MPYLQLDSIAQVACNGSLEHQRLRDWYRVEYHKEQNSDEYSYSDVLEFAKDASTGEILLTLKEGVEVSEIPNGKCDLLCADGSGKKFIRILFVLNDAK